MSTSSQSLDTQVPAAAVALPPPDLAVTPEVYAAVARLGLAEDFPAAIALTRELFGDFTIRISVDPEIDHCSYVTFKVRTSETVEEALDKEWEWFRRVDWPTEAEGSFCLDVDFDE